jgi:hypothetical protein
VLIVVLLRDKTPQNEEYSSESLAEHVCGLMDISTDNKEASDYHMLLERLMIEKLEDDNPDTQFREKVQELYVENRGIALDGLRDGLSLSGKSTRWL